MPDAPIDELRDEIALAAMAQAGLNGAQAGRAARERLCVHLAELVACTTKAALALDDLGIVLEAVARQGIRRADA